MTDDSPPPPMAMCAVCRHMLTTIERTDDVSTLAGDSWTIMSTEWAHPAAISFDHPPVPVPAVLSKIEALCDFCSEPESVATAYCTPFTVKYLGHEYRDNGSWSCCTDCATLLAGDQGEDLIARCRTIAHQRHHDPRLTEPLEMLLRAFLHHWTGGVVAGRPTS